MSNGYDLEEKEPKEQLNDEQAANNRIIATPRDVQEKMKHVNIVVVDPQVENLKNLEESDVEKLKFENDDLKNKLKMKEKLLEEHSEKIEVLGKNSEDLQQTTLDLIQAYSGLVEIWSEHLKNSQTETNRRFVKPEPEKILVESDLPSKKLMDLEESLKKYQREVCRLRKSNDKTVACCENWVDKWQILIERFKSILKKEDGNSEEVIKFEEELKLADDEMCWWFEYRCFNLSI